MSIILKRSLRSILALGCTGIFLFAAGCGEDASYPTTSITIVTATPLPAGTVGTAYSQTLTASGGTSPYYWTVASGSTLPAGLFLSTAGVVSGTPTAAGTVNTGIKVTDAVGGTATQTLSIAIANPAGAALSVTTASLPGGTVGTAYNQSLAASGGTSPYSWTVVSGSPLPVGLLLSTAGVVSGTPTAAGTVNTGIKVTDAAGGTATKVFPMAVSAATLACNGCHTIPPATGEHAFHVTSRSIGCATCHGTGYSATTVNAATHTNGTVNLVSSIGWNATTSTCASPGCHGSRPW